MTMPIRASELSLRRLAGAARRRARSSAYRRSLLERPALVKLYGVGNTRRKVRWYRNLDVFVDNCGSFRRRPGGRPNYLVGHNFIDEEFVQFPGPKVFSTHEPPMGMTAETNELIRSGGLDDHLYLYGHPDPEQRMYYPCLPQDRTKLTADLAATVEEPRPGLCCIVARYARDGAPNALQDERVAVVDAFGADMDIFGRAPWNGPNRWEERSTYRGPVADKIDTLRGYDFTLVYENCDVPGYVTEKLFDALRAGAVPLHRGGGGLLGEVVPPDCYVDCADRTPEQVHELVRSMSRDEVVARRRAGIRFLSSPAADRFTRQYWAEHVAARLRSQSAEG